MGKVFDGETDCPQCGAYEGPGRCMGEGPVCHATKYVRFPMDVAGQIRRTCYRCGYVWYEQALGGPPPHRWHRCKHCGIPWTEIVK